MDTGDDDDRAVLVMRDGRLAAVLTLLSDMHEGMAGQWFVEALFAPAPDTRRRVFADPNAFVAWLDGLTD
ncbi:hypothetical protein ACT009_17710 [Sphingomonas sp. Tas61C01]|uniref:hypothetical protein n=1 Tax=Sphingomonas sp. Tas61C01 TaxID=3458297 RepID=UPI00403E3F5E